ncbi:hypothetical protein B296_00045689 [Ensete ventricosum]|uniref:Uncharacterized protein n=1 Tax=Ensete ventricosum TaxID=4639 RepID=A0A426XCT3_ENSVE|nr:hypothetical protein B296_00045689 [Ensete ventricosum]
MVITCEDRVQILDLHDATMVVGEGLPNLYGMMMIAYAERVQILDLHDATMVVGEERITISSRSSLTCPPLLLVVEACCDRSRGSVKVSFSSTRPRGTHSGQLVLNEEAAKPNREPASFLPIAIKMGYRGGVAVGLTFYCL